MILLVDNYDSFVYNLARYFELLGQPTRVVRNDAIRVDDICRAEVQAVVLSPGPCTPAEAGCSINVVRHLHDTVPILGVCLGHQAIAAAFGGKIVRAPVPMHGRTSTVWHSGKGAFATLSNPLTACRYHSLTVDPVSLPDELEVIASTEDGVVMALEHRRWPVVGVQFHPESILTPDGIYLLANFLRLAGIEPRGAERWFDRELLSPPAPSPIPAGPVTF